MFYRWWWLSLLLLPLLATARPLFDVHLHYRAQDAELLSPPAMLEMFDALAIERAVIIGHPPQLAERLHRLAPARILPFLSVYRSPGDKHRWMHDKQLPAWVAQQLEAGPWRGIGELHIFASDRHSPVFRRLIELAGEHDLPLMIHGDPAVIDTLYHHAPQQPVIWAHAGTYPHPALLHDYLERYPALSVDLSVRSGRVAPEGELGEAWLELFLRHPERFLIGVDTFSRQRWRHFPELTEATRQWLSQLPPSVADALAHGNARRLFGTGD
ncbi:MAG: amidohydrolase family protein [Pseudomonadota bacterium]